MFTAAVAPACGQSSGLFMSPSVRRCVQYTTERGEEVQVLPLRRQPPQSNLLLIRSDSPILDPDVDGPAVARLEVAARIKPLDLPVRIGEVDFEVGLAGRMDSGTGRFPRCNVAPFVPCAGNMQHERPERLAAAVLDGDMNAASEEDEDQHDRDSEEQADRRFDMCGSSSSRVNPVHALDFSNLLSRTADRRQVT